MTNNGADLTVPLPGGGDLKLRSLAPVIPNFTIIATAAPGIPTWDEQQAAKATTAAQLIADARAVAEGKPSVQAMRHAQRAAGEAVAAHAAVAAEAQSH